jgi:cell division septal protein FtsQ
MTLKELLQHNENAQSQQDSLSINEQIEMLKKHKKSVFTLHMDDGRKLVRGDSESDRKEVEDFFKLYPQKGCKRIEFHK